MFSRAANVLTLFVLLTSTAFAQSAQVGQPNQLGFTAEDVQPSPQTRGRLYRPAAGPPPQVGIVVMHRTVDFRNHIANRELARRGFLVLGMWSRFAGDEAAVVWEKLPLDVKAGVEFLKTQPGITKIVLFGHSGGGSTMGCYQALAENGVAYSQGENKITQGTEELAGLPKADAVIFADAHPGIAVNALRRLNAAIADEDYPDELDQGLDPSNPGVQWIDENGETQFGDAFKDRYIRGQANRMDRLIERAQAMLAESEAAGVENPGAEPFEIAGGPGLRVSELFPEAVDRTKQLRQFLKNDGTVVLQVVVQARPQPRDEAAAGDSRRGRRGGGQARRGRRMSLQSFLTAGSVRATDSLENIDWCSTNSTTPCAAANISVPVLVVALSASSMIRDSEMIFEAAKSQDKEFILIEGSTHDFVPCTACEMTPGQYSNVTKNGFDFIATWINARF